MNSVLEKDSCQGEGSMLGGGIRKKADHSGCREMTKLQPEGD